MTAVVCLPPNLTFPENWPTPSFHYSSCATMHDHLSNSWALVNILVVCVFLPRYCDVMVWWLVHQNIAETFSTARRLTTPLNASMNGKSSSVFSAPTSTPLCAAGISLKACGPRSWRPDTVTFAPSRSPSSDTSAAARLLWLQMYSPSTSTDYRHQSDSEVLHWMHSTAHSVKQSAICSARVTLAPVCT